ncbi:hypothetical protein E4V99_02130 [Microbacterium sp. dk485]|uniref:hypothetical protein n=1 Tax=Microbacterium sp. dk485 TaxID=2560021 RepID=UPI0010742E1F|nr:hypothetical protein [Microbacterium sp. dk485]TFV83901.1 hypothetical protein E4V99_02130 [Microbacterium sp. dk485]
MRAWIIRFASLYVFDVVVLLVIGALVPGVRVGLAALWAGAVLAAATIWLKPLIHRWFRSMAARSAAQRSWLAEKLVQYVVVLGVAAIIWVLLVLFTGVNVRGFVFGWFVPPIFLLIAWAIYDLVDDRIEARAAELYDRATAGRRATTGPDVRGSVPPVPPASGGFAPPAPGSAGFTPPPAPRSAASGSAASARRNEGLTDEQRRMLDDL